MGATDGGGGGGAAHIGMGAMRHSGAAPGQLPPTGPTARGPPTGNYSGVVGYTGATPVRLDSGSGGGAAHPPTIK